MGQHQSLQAESQEHAAHQGQQTDSTGVKGQGQGQGQREAQGQNPSPRGHTTEQGGSWTSTRPLTTRKNVIGTSKDSPVSAMPISTTAGTITTTAPATSALGSRANRCDTDLGRMSVREAIDSFIESRLSAPNESPPPCPISASHQLNGLRSEDSRSSDQGDNAIEKDRTMDKTNTAESEDCSPGSSLRPSKDSLPNKDSQQQVTENKDSGSFINDGVDEDCERLSDKELVIDCDTNESPQAIARATSSTPPKDSEKDYETTLKSTAKNQSQINLSDTSCGIKNEEQDLKTKNSKNAADYDPKRSSPSGKQEKQTFSDYLQDKLKAQLASHVDSEAQGHLYLWDLNKASAATSATPVTPRTGSVRLQTLIDKVLDQSIGKSLGTNPDVEYNSLFASLKQSSEMSTSPKETKSSEQSTSSQPPASEPQDSLPLQSISSLCFKDHIEKVVVENFLSYEEEEKNESSRQKEGSPSVTDTAATPTPEAEGDRSKVKRDGGAVGPDGTFSVQNIVDRVISQTEVISKLLTPTTNEQHSERVSPGRNTNRESHGGNHSSPSSGQSATMLGSRGSSSEGQRGSAGDGQPSISMGRKRGRPRLSSPSRPNPWPSDRSSGSGSDHGSSVFRDPQTGDYRSPAASQLPGSIHGRMGGPAVPQQMSKSSRSLAGPGPPPLDIIASQGSIQHGIPVGALVTQQVPNQLYHSTLHPHHPHAQHFPSDNQSSATRPILTSSVPSPHSPHHSTYQRVLHQPSSHPHLPQPPSSHGHPQHHHRPSDHHASHFNKPLPPLIHANHINEKTGVNNTSMPDGGISGSSSNTSSGNSRLVPVSHIPTASCSCTNCVAIYSRDKTAQLATSSSLHQQQMRRNDPGVPFQMAPSKHSDIRRDDGRPHHQFSVYDGSVLSPRSDQLASPQAESLKPVVGVGGKAVPHQAVMPSYVAARRPMDRAPGMESHPRDEHYPRDGKVSHYPSYSPQGKPTSSDVAYAEDERYRRWLRAHHIDPQAPSQATAYAPFDQSRRASGGHSQRRQSPEKVVPQQPQPLDLQKSGYPSEAPMTSTPLAQANADQPLDLSVKSSPSEMSTREVGEIQRPLQALRNDAALYQNRNHHRPTHAPARELDPHDPYGTSDVSIHGRPDTTLERTQHLGHAYPPGQRAFTTPPGAQYPQTVSSKDGLPHPPMAYGPRVDGRGHIQPPAERPYPANTHIMSPNNQTASSNRESPTQRSSRQHPYAPYPLTSSSSPSPSLQIPQQQPPHSTTPQPPGMPLPPHLRGTVGPPTHGNNLPYQRRSPYSDASRPPPKPQDPRAPSPHYSNVGGQRKTPDTHNYPILPTSQESGEHRGAHNSLPPTSQSHPQPGVSPDDHEALKHCVSKHEPIQNIIGNHPQNDILYLICKLCRQTYGSPYGFRKHFRNQHGFEPKVEHTIVQTISATKTAMGHSGPADPHMAEVERKGMLVPETQSTHGGEISATFKADFTGNTQGMEKHSQDTSSLHVKVQDDLKGEIKSEPKLESGLENTKFLECPECGQSFQLNDFGSYKRHCRQHSVNQYSGPFSCHDCQKSFAEPGQLQQHLNTHKSFTPSLCGFCPTFFSSPHYLAGHLKAAHGHVIPSEALKKSSEMPDVKNEVKTENSTGLDLHGMIETALMESNVPCCSKPRSQSETTIVSSSATSLSSSSHQERIPTVSSSIGSLPLSKRHKATIASSDPPLLTTVHTPKKLEVQKLPADAVVTTASPDSSFEEGKGQAADSQPRKSSSSKSGEMNQSPSNSGNSQSQVDNKEPSLDSQDSSSNHSILSASGGSKRDDNNKSRSGLPPGQTETLGLSDKGSSKDDTESLASDRCQSVDSNSQSVGGSRTSSPGCDDVDKFYKHKKYSRHRKRMSSSDVSSEPESKTPKLSSNQDDPTAGSVSSSNTTSTVVQVCESSSGGQCDGKSGGSDSSSLSQEEAVSNTKTKTSSSKSGGKGDKSSSKENGKYGLRESTTGGDSKKSEGGDAISKFKWDRLTRSHTGKSPQTVSCSNS